ncbi:MAG: hypothetical protein V2I26_08115, partial [Halieaceae bacterium]|nr:hypothetical protein [Halieaceae bacterium]
MKALAAWEGQSVNPYEVIKAWGHIPLREDRFWSFAPTPVAVVVLMSAYILAYSFTSILTYRNFGMSAFDIGIHDQAIWKIAHGRGL